MFLKDTFFTLLVFQVVFFYVDSGEKFPLQTGSGLLQTVLSLAQPLRLEYNPVTCQSTLKQSKATVINRLTVIHPTAIIEGSDTHTAHRVIGCCFHMTSYVGKLLQASTVTVVIQNLST